MNDISHHALVCIVSMIALIVIWSVNHIGVELAFVALVAGIVYWPIKKNSND